MRYIKITFFIITYLIILLAASSVEACRIIVHLLSRLFFRAYHWSLWLRYNLIYLRQDYLDALLRLKYLLWGKND